MIEYFVDVSRGGVLGVVFESARELCSSLTHDALLYSFVLEGSVQKGVLDGLIHEPKLSPTQISAAHHDVLVGGADLPASLGIIGYSRILAPEDVVVA